MHIMGAGWGGAGVRVAIFYTLANLCDAINIRLTICYLYHI